MLNFYLFLSKQGYLKSFKGKTVWITGASSGIGEALVKQFAYLEANIVLSARNEQELNRVQKEAKLTNENSLVLLLDLGKQNSFSELTKKVVSKFGEINLLINNGGVSQRSNAIETSSEVERSIMEVNYFGTIALTKAVLPYMLQQKGGEIVVVSSLGGKIGFYLRSTYCASKHALHGYFETLRMELASNQIGVLLVCPEKVKTKMSVNALKGDGETHNKVDASMARGTSAEECAKQIITAIKKGKEEIYIGSFKGRLALILKSLLPRLFSKLVRKQKVE